VRPGSFRAWRGRRGVSGSSRTREVRSGPDDTPASAPSIKNPSGRKRILLSAPTLEFAQCLAGSTLLPGYLIGCAEGRPGKTKNRDTEKLTGHRRFLTSQGIYRPEESRAESVGEVLARLQIPEECKTFEITYSNTPLVGKVTYRHYDLRKRRQGGP